MLLVRPQSHPDECLVSYIIRVSEKNGFKHLGHLLHYAGLNWKNNRAPVHQILTGEFNIAPLLSALALSETRSKVAPVYQSFQRVTDAPSLFAKYPKVCPDCLEEFGYCKYQWVLLPVVVCTKHKKMLIDVNPASGKPLGWYRRYLNQFDGESTPIKTTGNTARSAAIQLSLYFEFLLSGKNNDRLIPVVLQGLEFREALSMIHFIAHYRARLVGDAFRPVSMGNYSLAQHYLNVWSVLQDWPNSFYALLSQYIDHPMSAKGAGGINKHYRDLYENLHRQRDNEGVARIKIEFDRYIETYWPEVLESDRITRINFSSTPRNIISKKEAAQLIGSRPERIDKLVQLEKLSIVVFKGKGHYLRDEVEDLANTIGTNWSMGEACEALQVTRYQLKQLLDTSIIFAIQKPDKLNRDWIIDKCQCQALVAHLRQNGRKDQSPMRALSMEGIQRQGFSIVQLISAMQANQVQYEVCENSARPYSLKQFTAFIINARAP
ncbi:MAG TPA: TniQ family protein [Pseudomonadales bacterium]|nr:TniQ family protein [Pseudomonadales bacterium]